jgi:imidazole glycerol-phosphate synthase subunit HisF
MLQKRVIPVLLLKNKGLVKTEKFKKPTYVGDPLNAVKIFNEKEVDELVFLDIDASEKQQVPDLATIAQIAAECFIPFSYGGNISTLNEIQIILKLGVEKVIINSAALRSPNFINEACITFGGSSIVAAMDVKKNLFGKHIVYSKIGIKPYLADPVAYAVDLETRGAGEIFINNVDADGVMKGYDIQLIKKITDAVRIPVTACGGAGNIKHMEELSSATGVTGIAAGSMFVFHGPHKAVLINYPSRASLQFLNSLKFTL